MKNVVGVLLAALGAGLVAGAFSILIGAVLAGLVLLAGSLLLVIDWDGG